MDPDGESSTGARALTGQVTEQLPHRLYRVKLDGGGLVTAHIADRLARNFVRVLVGDRVRIEMRDAQGKSIFGAIDQRVIRA